MDKPQKINLEWIPGAYANGKPGILSSDDKKEMKPLGGVNSLTRVSMNRKAVVKKYIKPKFGGQQPLSF